MNAEANSVLQSVIQHQTGAGIAIDGGAHIGAWTIPLSEKFNRVVAFEPDPISVGLLRSNTKHLANVRVIHAALGWNTKGKVKMMWRFPGHSDTSRIDARGVDADVESIDSYGVRDVSFIKLDLEGFEFFALRGAERTLRDYRPSVLIEEKDHLPQHYGLPMRAAREWLESIGMIVVKQFKIDVLFDWPKTEETA